MCRNPHGDHPERPERLTAVMDALKEEGLAAKCVTRVPGRLVTREEVALVHERNHWDRIEAAVSSELAELDAFVAQHESIYLNAFSLDAARRACGAVLDLCDAVVSGRAHSPSNLSMSALDFRFLRPGRPPPYGEVTAKSMCFCESTRTMKEGMLTICLPTRMWRWRMRTRAW